MGGVGISEVVVVEHARESERGERESAGALAHSGGVLDVRKTRQSECSEATEKEEKREQTDGIWAPFKTLDHHRPMTG